MAEGGPEAPRRRTTWQAIAALAVAGLVGANGMWFVMRNGPHQPVLRPVHDHVPAHGATWSSGGGDATSPPSPDGRYLVYQSGSRLMVRAFDDLDAVPLSGVIAGRTPFFSPDSRWIGFFDGSDLKKVTVLDGRVITLSRDLGSPNGGSWGDDGTIVVSSEDGTLGLRRISADGGEAIALTRTDAPHHGHRTPSMLPGGRGVLFTVWANAPEDRQLAVLDLKSGEQTLLRGGVAPVPRHRASRLRGQRFAGVGGIRDNLGGRVRSRATRPAPGNRSVSATPCRSTCCRQCDYTVSRGPVRSPTCRPTRGRARSCGSIEQVAKRPSAGCHRARTQISDCPPTARASPSRIEDGEADVFVWDFARESLTRLTFGFGFEYLPRWTPDGRWIVFQSNREGTPNLFSVPSDGSGPVERLTTSRNVQYPNSITPDGTTLLLCELRAKTGFDILRLPLVAAARAAGAATTVPDERPSEATALVASLSAEFAANISPDGRYIAHQSAESGGTVRHLCATLP